MKRIACIIFLSFLAFTLQAQVDRSKMPEPGPAPEVNLEKPRMFSMKNGLKVLVVENNKLPRVSAQLTIDNPPVLEGEKAGVSSLTASLLGNGSKTVPKDEYHEEVDFLGAQIFFGAQSAFAASLSKYFPRILELMADAAIHPNFTQEEFEKEKAKLITSLKAQENDVSAIASRAQYALAYGKDHPYGEFVTEETVNTISLQDVNDYYSNYFVPANAYLVIVGDIRFEEAEKLVTRFFSPWPKAAPPSQEYSKPSDAQNTQINFVDMPNAVQSEVSLQNLTELQMKNEDYLHALLANRILGGGAQARLFLNLREDKGYTYGSYSSLEHDKYAPSLFQATASVRNAVTDSTVTEMLAEVNRIINEPVTDEELRDAKAKYVGNFVIALEKPENIAKYALNIETEDLPDDFYTTYLERINAVSGDQVREAAKKYFTSSNARVVVTGKGSEVLENLEKLTFNGKPVPVKYYDRYANATEKPDYSSELPAGVSVESVIGDYFEAIGGKAKVDEIHSLKLIYQGTAMGSSIRVEEMRTKDKFAQTTYMNDAPMMGVIAKGDDMYMKQGGNTMPLPAAMQDDLKYVMGIFPEQGILNTDTARVAGVEKVDGRDAYKIEVPGEMVQASYFYDVETGLKLKENILVSVNGQTQNQELIYRDYETVEGIEFPTVRIGNIGQELMESTLLEAHINKGVTESDFD